MVDPRCFIAKTGLDLPGPFVGTVGSDTPGGEEGLDGDITDVSHDGGSALVDGVVLGVELAAGVTHGDTEVNVVGSCKLVQGTQTRECRMPPVDGDGAREVSAI